ncbi:MAG: SPOR domain-containing protein, partial [Eggerthellaceae bacterium]|nr:SPOR domain-containing protein [Eggerthellaceae bacterium]
ELDKARDFEPGGVSRPVKATVDIDKFKAVADKNKTEYSLSLHAVNKSTGDEIAVWSLQWNENQGLNVFYGGTGGPGYSVTLFAVLDVDANPTSIRFTGEEANPRVEDTFRIETVVAPTKSCTVVCKDVYSVNGELQETPEYTVTVRVPVFMDGAFGAQRGITAELAAQPDMGDLQMQRVADTYRYDPQSIYNNSTEGLAKARSNAQSAASSSEKTAVSSAETSAAVSNGTNAAAAAASASSSVATDGISSRTEPFWGVWALASKDRGLADEFAASARQANYDAAVFITSEWGNLNSEPWYAVSLCCADSEADANAVLERAKREGYADAYVKHSGDRL